MAKLNYSAEEKAFNLQSFLLIKPMKVSVWCSGLLNHEIDHVKGFLLEVMSFSKPTLSSKLHSQTSLTCFSSLCLLLFDHFLLLTCLVFFLLVSFFGLLFLFQALLS
jgi:hypothetical protein